MTNNAKQNINQSNITERSKTRKDRLTVTVPEMAEMLGIGRIKAYELANIKGFPAIRLGKRIVVPVDQLKKWLEERAGAGDSNE